MNRSMLALVTDAFGGRGGIAQYNRDFLGAVAESGAFASIAVLVRHAVDEPSVPAGIRQQPPRPGRLAYSVVAISAALRMRFGIVFCGHLYMAPLAYAVARLSGAKLVLQMHGIEAWPRPGDLIRCAAERADMILCVSRHTRARVLDWAAIMPEKVVVVPNTVGSTFTPGDGSGLREKWKLEGRRIVLTVGRLDSRERYKGHDRVIAALPALVRAGYDVVYVVIGEGDDIGRLTDLAVTGGLEGRVRFVGLVDPATLIDAYRTADLFVMPSTGEGFGIAFVEAMACGTPALGVNVAGTRDALSEGELGILVGEENLADVLSAALSRPKPDGQMLYRSVRARFGRAHFCTRVNAVVGGLLLKAAG